MSDALIRKLSGFSPVEETVRELFHRLCDEIVAFEPGVTLVGQGADYAAVWLIEAGWVLRSRTVEDGGRQIVSVAVAGDFVGLNALLFRTSDFDHVCRTPVQAFRIPPVRLREAFESHPTLAAALFWVTAREESILAERIVSLGRRGARARAAHVLCEFMARLEIICGAGTERLAVPLSQEDLADVLGISAVHTNKVLRGLERDGVISFRKGVLMIHDRAMLEQVAGFDGGYLHFTRRSDLLPG